MALSKTAAGRFIEVKVHKGKQKGKTKCLKDKQDDSDKREERKPVKTRKGMSVNQGSYGNTSPPK